MSAAAPRRVRARVVLLLVFVAAWTLFAMYPDPAVLVRNFARYRDLPIDPQLEQRKHWELPRDPGTIELFVDSLLLSRPDWPLFRVPWYVPTAAEAADMTHGDCEARALVLASLLEGKGIPYEIRASFSHIWVDYEGRVARPGESGELAYLRGEPGALSMRWPESVDWRSFLAAQRGQLWDAMPLARKAIWILGLIWVGLGAALVGGEPPRGDLLSQWRVRPSAYASKSLWLGVLFFTLIVVIYALWPDVRGAAWTAADLAEVTALSLLAGAFAAWLIGIRPRLAVRFGDGGQMQRAWSQGMLRGSSSIERSQIAQFELAASGLGFGGWTISATLGSGEQLTLLRYRSEIAARAAIRQLATQASRPMVVRAQDRDYWTAADEVGLALRDRFAARPKAESPPPPEDLHLAVEESAYGWSIGYPCCEARAVRSLLVMAGLACGVGILGAALVGLFSAGIIAWVVWCASVVFLGMTVYAAIFLRDEILAWLGGSRVEVSGAEVRFRRADGRVETVAAASLESVELSQQGHCPTIALVAPERVIHVRLYCHPKHRDWVRAAIERAIGGR